MGYNNVMRRLRQYILIFTWGLLVPAMAQDITPTPTFIELEAGTQITGRIDNRNSREVYFIDGARGEVIQLVLAVTSGTLDPVLSVFDDSGRLIVYRDDTAGTVGIQHSLALPQSGRFYVVVGRFGYSLGATVGEYELRMERTGVLSQQGSTLRYGDSVIDTISDTTPQVYYTFQAEQGDLLTISMVRASGTLDPYIQVVSSDRFVIADNDDQIGSDTQNARIDTLLIEQNGTYVIVASRYGGVAGDSVGSFALTLDEAQNSGIGNSSLAPLPITYGQTIEASINTQQYERFYTFNARRDDIVTISMRRGVSGRLDSYLILADDQFVTLIEDDDSGTGQNAQIGTYRIPADGKYYIITTRYDGKEGTSEGDYILTIETSGNAFDTIPDGIPTLNYGASVTGNINPDNLVDLYAFYANQGDVITISMNRSDGNLDTVVDLLDDAQQLILRDDDGGNGQNSRIERYDIPATGLYYIRAQRYDGTTGDANTTGSYVLVLAQRFD
jgi:hypothetical protein